MHFWYYSTRFGNVLYYITFLENRLIINGEIDEKHALQIIMSQTLVLCSRVYPSTASSTMKLSPGPVFSYKLRYIVGFGLVEMAISTNPKPAIYCNLYENTVPGYCYFIGYAPEQQTKWISFMPPLCIFRLNLTRRTSCGWLDDIAIQTQDVTVKHLVWFPKAYPRTTLSCCEDFSVTSCNRKWLTNKPIM